MKHSPIFPMQRTVRLSLVSPIYYYPAELSLDDLLTKVDREDIGYDAVIKYSFRFNDEILITNKEFSGERKGYTAEEKTLIENGITIDRKKGEDIEIPSGTYLFQQLPFIPQEKDLNRIMLPFLKSKNGYFFARIYKENMLECVFQLLFPTL